MTDSVASGVSQHLAVVVIGRNEGERLKRCLASVQDQAQVVVYVDSGSTDQSAAYARSVGAEVVELDMSVPFSAARARNAGFERAKVVDPDVSYVQFLDGDTEVNAGWLPKARASLEQNPTWAVVCGRRRERFPEASPYNRLCDIEWDTPIGEADASGGDCLVRRSVLDEVGGYNPIVVAGEEPELCHRLRMAGYQIHRLALEMTLHDAAMHRFGQFMKRKERAGYAFALVAALHFRSPQRIWVKEVVSILVWGLLPLGLLGLSFVVGPWAWLGLILYPRLFLKVAAYSRRRGLSPADARLFAAACTLGKFVELRGVFNALSGLALGRQQKIIEYKAVGA